MGGIMAALKEKRIRTVVVGTGAAGYAAAVRLYQCGERDLAVLAEAKKAGTSRNTGSDKQTYYKLSVAGGTADSVRAMAEDLFRGQCVDGDQALCEAALSARCFYRLMELGVPFPENAYGEAIGYQTDHDSRKRASSVGPYTSKIMTECLEKEAARCGIPVLDHMQMIRILVKDGKCKGVLCLNTEDRSACAFTVIWCENLVLATGGPAGMYHDSVYPASQRGSSGLAFEAGVRGKNLTEWQFGMASLKPRWNVSGTYMQALPRFVSTDQEGNDPREFLLDSLKDPVQVQFLTFMKGYQWPFDVNKIFGGSSLLDLLVYRETVLENRRVFLDFRQNPCKDQVEFEKLPEEAKAYLSAAGACFGTPYERLLCMNEPAVLFYREHGVDLSKEMLEIAVCAQHNNGGLAADCHWQTDVEGIFAVGEVCGSHGVTRPGGSALNAGQVGAVRAAEYIAYIRNREAHELTEEDRAYCLKLSEDRIRMTERFYETSNIDEAWNRASVRMSRAAGMIREESILEQALCETRKSLETFGEEIRISRPEQAGKLYRLWDLLTAQNVYLTAMLDYIRHGGMSRGSALYTCPDGELPQEHLPELYRCRLDRGKLGGFVQETALDDSFRCRTFWRTVRPVPEPDYFFETEWKAFRERRGQEPGSGI